MRVSILDLLPPLAALERGGGSSTWKQVKNTPPRLHYADHGHLGRGPRPHLRDNRDSEG